MTRHRAETPKRPALPRAAAVTLAFVVLVLAAAVPAREWLSMGGHVVPLASPAADPDAAPTPDAPPEAAEPAAAEPAAGSVTVHVTGAVASPGVYVLPLGRRVDDAIAAAGGLGAEADEAALNRAQVLADAQQVYVPTFGELLATAADSGGTMNLNTATASQLEELPGVGPSLAGQIVAWREEHGPFSSVEDLDAVPGIGPAILEKVRAQVTV